MLPLGLTSGYALLTHSVSYPLTAVYNPKAFIPHAASLRQAFAHCGRFSTAASRRSLGCVSVPMWPDTLSGRLPVKALVGRYPANCLIGPRPLLKRKLMNRGYRLPASPCGVADTLGISSPLEELSPSSGQVT